MKAFLAPDGVVVRFDPDSRYGQVEGERGSFPGRLDLGPAWVSRLSRPPGADGFRLRLPHGWMEVGAGGSAVVVVLPGGTALAGAVTGTTRLCAQDGPPIPLGPAAVASLGRSGVRLEPDLGLDHVVSRHWREANRALDAAGAGGGTTGAGAGTTGDPPRARRLPPFAPWATTGSAAVLALAAAAAASWAGAAGPPRPVPPAPSRLSGVASVAGSAPSPPPARGARPAPTNTSGLAPPTTSVTPPRPPVPPPTAVPPVTEAAPSVKLTICRVGPTSMEMTGMVSNPSIRAVQVDMSVAFVGAGQVILAQGPVTLSAPPRTRVIWRSTAAREGPTVGGSCLIQGYRVTVMPRP